MAQQTEAVWTEAQSADELNAGDEVRVVDDVNGSAVIDTATVRDALEGVGTVNLSLATGRTREVRFQDDGSVKVRGDCFTYVLEVRREVATDGGRDVEQGREEPAAPSPEDDEYSEGDQVVIHYESRASYGVREEPAEVTGVQEDGALEVEFKRDANGTTSTLQGEVRVDDGEWDTFWAIGHGRQDDVQQGSVVRVPSLTRKAWEREQSPYFCMACEERKDSAACVNTGHGSTGDTGCPDCHSAPALRNVVHEVGDERGITYGYITEGQRDHGSCITLEAAEAIAQREE